MPWPIGLKWYDGVKQNRMDDPGDSFMSALSVPMILNGESFMLIEEKKWRKPCPIFALVLALSF